MIDTYSQFFYGIQVDGSNNKISVQETSQQVSISISPGAYSVTGLLNEISRKLNAESLNDYVYTVAMNRTTRLVTITCGTAVTILNNGGESSILTELGFDTVDFSSVTTLSGISASVDYFAPQLMLQDYVPLENSKGVISGSRKISLTGAVQVVKWGTKRTTEFNIKWQTNKDQGAGNWVKNSASGYTDLNNFMNHITNQNIIEFMPDIDAPSTYYAIICEKTPESTDGIEYKLKERYDINARDYYDSGLLEFREVEG